MISNSNEAWFIEAMIHVYTDKTFYIMYYVLEPTTFSSHNEPETFVTNDTGLINANKVWRWIPNMSHTINGTIYQSKILKQILPISYNEWKQFTNLPEAQ